MSDLTFEQVKILVEQLPTDEIERLRNWLNHSIEPPPEADSTLTWGERLVALVNQFDLDETDLLQGDPEQWVRDHRQAETQRRNPGWGTE